MNIPAEFLVHSVTIAPKTGEGSRGAIFGPSFDVACYRSETNRKVLSASGDEVLSSATLMVTLDDEARIPIGSRITWTGKSAHVLATARADDGGMGAWQHGVISCG